MATVVTDIAIASQKRKSNSGLPLSPIKCITETCHNGRIYVKRSTVGKGTTFRITLRE